MESIDPIPDEGAGCEPSLEGLLMARGAARVDVKVLFGRGMEGLTLAERLERLLTRHGDGSGSEPVPPR